MFELKDRLQIVPADISAYNGLKFFHYRHSKLGPYKKIFAIKAKSRNLPGYYGEPLGVIVYSMPSPNCQLRTIATAGKYSIGDNTAKLRAINRDIRCISRVIIEPRLRGFGLASWLVSQTLQMAQTPIVEALAVMGDVNPFFQKAGMKKYTAPLPLRCVRIKQALSAINIDDLKLLDAENAYNHIVGLPDPARNFIICELNKFLQSYGPKLKNTPLKKQLQFTLLKISHRPAYFIWHRDNQKGKKCTQQK